MRAGDVGPEPTGLCSAHRGGEVGCTTCFPPSLLWSYANNLHPRNDANRQTLYLQLMVEHGYVVVGPPPIEQYPLDQSPPWINRHRHD